MRTAPGAGLFKAYRRLRAGGSSLLPIEDCLLQLPFAGVSCFLRFLLAARVPQTSFRSPARPSSVLSTALRSRRSLHPCHPAAVSFSTTAAQIASHLQPSRAPPRRSVSWARQTLPLSRDSYHIVRSFLPALHASTCSSSALLPYHQTQLLHARHSDALGSLSEILSPIPRSSCSARFLRGSSHINLDDFSTCLARHISAAQPPQHYRPSGTV
jgi:hypothetical protein